jgi:hypothetical protein
MPPETGTALLILVGFVLPGFVTVQIKERLHDSPDTRTDFNRLLQVAYYSVWSYLLLALFALIVDIRWDEVRAFGEERFDDPALLVLCAAAAILVPSGIVATASIAWSDWDWVNRAKKAVNLNPHHQTPTAWDHFFSEQKPALVRVVLKDERLVGGYYGSESFAAYAKDGRDLYLERLWQLDPDTGWFVKEAPATQGVWIPTQDVVEVEFYNSGTDGGTTRQGRTQATAGGAASDDAATGSDSASVAEPGSRTAPAPADDSAAESASGTDAAAR